MQEFANAQAEWSATWPTDPKDRAMVIESVKMWQRSYFYVRNVAMRGDWVNLPAFEAGPPAGRLPNCSYRARSLTPAGAGTIT